MKFSNSHLFITVVIGSVVVFFLFLFQPSYQAIKLLKSEILDGQMRKVEESQVSLVLAERKRRIKKLREEVERLQAGLLKRHEYSPLMKALRELSSELGFQNESISLKGQEHRDHFEAAILDLKLTGGFEEIYRFIQGLEDLSVAVQIDRLILRGEPQSNEWIQAHISLSAPLSGM